MSFDENGFYDDNALRIINWWERELSGEERHYLLDGYIWKGTPQERLEKLKQMKAKWDSLGCPHCGSTTKHTFCCPDQQIINAFRDLKSVRKHRKRVT